MANKDTVKPWFETGDYPTQAQFWQMFDWLRWKDELLNISDVQGLQELVNSIITLSAVKVKYIQLLSLISDGSFTMDAGLIITGIIVDAPNDLILNIGTTPGGNDILDSLPITGGKQEPITLMIYAKTEKAIYFSGINSSTDFILLKNSL